ncbi:FG-GAP-like repeat-containing protein [Parasedimentitalea huanghaiensis]|uniref:Insecticide toxin TcdB middle/N-terminal domain-containing protein n=1 Tax=Parasedimentitalea huanghaiensis TaxID=2682100 RepID=A0A6L6WKW8_9RHOB|nr:FG-GAP-like repeat-containing protein [Zongyanglinia huanghaiensis]MVO18483.1 hypothetical protein [Zongyanglinia huanghaiensis]
MHKIVRGFLPALAFLALPFHLAYAGFSEGVVGPEPSVMPEVKTPQGMNSDGSFRKRITFDIPAFRGLEPNLGLSYNSSFKGKGSPETWLGVGWQLNGFSTIERVSLGGGTPTYDDNYDLFRLDGTELLACRDAQALAPLPTTRAYPDRYVTETKSASCLAGGNLSTMVESYRKIEMKYQTIGGKQVEFFEVTNTKGVRYIYRSVGAIAGDISNGADDEYNVLFRRKFLLTEIQDVQATPNIVTFNYDFSSKAEARAHRPADIQYGNGYKVSFGYDQPSSRLSSYAVGSGSHFGEQKFRLRSVFVHDGSAKIRAYDLEYQTAAVTSASLLTAVTPYGSDFTLNSQNSGVIDGGSVLPGKVRNSIYAPDLNTLTQQTFAGQVFHRGLQVLDVDGNNKDDLVFADLYNKVGGTSIIPSCWGGGNLQISNPPPQFEASRDSNGDFVLNAKIAHPAWSVIGRTSASVIGRTSAVFGYDRVTSVIKGILPPDAQRRDYGFLLHETYSDYTHQQGGGEWTRVGGALRFVGLGSNGANYEISSDRTDYVGNPIAGNFDNNSDQEFYLKNQGGGVDHIRLASQSGTKQSIGIGQFNEHSALLAQLDMDGDGMKELVYGTTFNYNNPPSYFDGEAETGFPVANSEFPASSPRRWKTVDFRNLGAYHSLTDELDTFPLAKFVPADVNGDGQQDLVYVAPKTGGTAIYVALSTGNDFLPPQIWADSPLTGLAAGSKVATAGDVNGDGLTDIVVNTPSNFHGQQNCGEGDVQDYTLAFGSSTAHIFLSNGSSFIPPETSGLPSIPGFIGAGDVDGNGLIDFVQESATSGTVWFGDGQVANLLTQFTNDAGGATEVAYAPSTKYTNDNRVPGVSQLVDTLTVNDGRGSSRQTQFSYVGSKYDYENRRSLGYRTVTAYLPKLSNETEGPVVVTTYLNDHFSQRGKIKSQIRTTDGTTTYSKVINDWSGVQSGNGPYRVTKTASRTSALSGDQLIETKKEFAWTDYGPLSWVRHFGFTNAGADLDAGDNTITVFSYRPHLANYIVSLPRWKTEMEGHSNTAGRSDWLSRELYYYDGSNTNNDTPVKGQLTRVRLWDGDRVIPTTVYLEMDRYAYDSHGNLTQHTNPRGNVATYSYDTTRHLFRLTETNAKGHLVTTAWDEACQAPDLVTDINGLVTDYTYDAHCREDYVTVPGGNYVDTQYNSFGSATAQYIRKITKSPSTVSGSTTQESREYFDGFGEVYKTAATGSTSAEVDLITSVRGYDVRGNLSWQSNPLSWAASSAVLPDTSKTRFEYDPADRPTWTYNPDGSKTQQIYEKHTFTINGVAIAHPRVSRKDEHCFDPTADATICGQNWTTFDARSNLFRSMVRDVADTDVDSGSSQYRTTQYRYDLLNRMVGVTDPGGAIWTYTYDSRGNRLTADDPGLGYWTMEYDANNNLTRQVDAKGQEIAFSHDELDRVSQKQVTWTKNGTSRTDNTTYVYDEPYDWLVGRSNVGMLTRQNNANHMVQYGYDENGNRAGERHYDIHSGGNFYWIEREFDTSGALVKERLPYGTGSEQAWTLRAWTPEFSYDAAGRVTGFGNYVTNTSYNLRSQPTWTDFSSGVREEVQYDVARGWTNKIHVHDVAGTAYLDRRRYYRSATGRVNRQWSGVQRSRFNYCYDYAGRLLVAADLDAAGKTCGTVGSWTGAKPQDQVFSYRSDGAMASNSFVGSYDYSSSPVDHAPKQITGGDSFTYDANGNMTTGLNGKVMTYDGENRPLTVTALNGDQTEYVYGADGSRLKRIETVNGAVTTSLYVGGVELVQAPNEPEQAHWYPHSNVRMSYEGGTFKEVKYLHRDQLGSVFSITNATGTKDVRRDFAPFGDERETIHDTAMASYPAKEDIGYIGEREDEAAGLMYLNARYYDPELALFIPTDPKAAKPAAMHPTVH